MERFFKNLIPSKLKTVGNSSDTDLKGFDLADNLEGGVSERGGANWSKPMENSDLFLIRKRTALNEWSIADHQSRSFAMRAVVDAEVNGQFAPNWGDIGDKKRFGRVRVRVFLSESATDPAVVMISSVDRLDWKVFTFDCDACRYKRRRSSFTEASDDDSPVSLARSVCSYVHTDLEFFEGLIPSGQEILRMRHLPIAIKECSFTKISVSLPVQGTSWCPVLRVPLSERKIVSLSSKSPIYSEKLKALALEFRQRNVIPSRRNFQLLQKLDQPEDRPITHHYRSGKDEYILELSAPLSLVQGFCIALSTILWQ